ncbi:MAG: PAS domain-containing protein [Desulfamplus sp.]|nr:PAS domain-containing protein [Desulfamplus sp.]
MRFPYNTASYKKNTKRQKETENLYYAFFNTTPAGSVITTLHEGKIIDINESMVKMIGFSREECIGRTIIDIGFYPDIKARDNIIKLLIEKKSIHNQEMQFLTSSGDCHYGIFSAELIELQNQPCIFLSIFSITGKLEVNGNMEAKTSLENGENSVNKFEMLFEYIPDMLFVIDYTGKILHTNRAASERLGYSDVMFKKMHILNIHPSDKKYDVVNIMGRILSGETDRFDIPLLTFTGEVIPVDTKVVLTHWDDKKAVLGISREK